MNNPPDLKGLNLYFPQWQGSTRKHIYHGAKLLHEKLQSTLPFLEVHVDEDSTLEQAHNVEGFAVIRAQLAEAHQQLQMHQPQQVRTLGGDCGVEVAPLGYLNHVYAGDLAVLWLDAHGDLNTPDSSPSKHFHGMPLRHLLGEGTPALMDLVPTPLRPEQVLLCGVRELDAPEQAYIDHAGITRISVDRLATDGQHVNNIIEQRGFKHVYVHFDVDALDPAAFPHSDYPTPHGLRIADLRKLLRNLKQVVGFTLTEFAPKPGYPLDGVEAIIGIFTDVMQSFAQ